MDYKRMCVQQGYIPETCLLDGQMAWLLVQDGKDPCKGCNHNRSECNGRFAPYENKDYGVMCFLDEMDKARRKQIEEESKRQEEIKRLRQEKHYDGFTRVLLEIKQEYTKGYYEIEIIVKDIVNETAYITRCKDITDMIHIIYYCRSKYKVEQIHIEENGIGAGFYNIVANEINDIDIVPLRYRTMKFN